MSDASLPALDSNCGQDNGSHDDNSPEFGHNGNANCARPREQAQAAETLKLTRDAKQAVPAGINLRPFADQLFQIAEQLRQGDVGAQTHSTQVSSTVHGREPSDAIKLARHAPTAAPAQSAKRIETLPLTQRRERYAAMARAIYAVRRKRNVIFGDAELFGEPAWDILLDLYIASAQNKPVSVSSACIGSASPPTTGLRWLGVLAEQQFVLREHDPLDQRRVLVRLTEKGLSAMDQYFASASAEEDVFGPSGHLNPVTVPRRTGG